MGHVLKGKLSIDVDDAISLGSLSGLRFGGLPAMLAFFDPRDPRVTIPFLDAWIELGRLAGLRYAPQSWDSGRSPEECAAIGSNYVKELEEDGVRRIAAVEWDVETHDRLWQLKFLLGSVDVDGTRHKGIRGAGGSYPDPTRPATLGLRWGRPGVWTYEGRQDAGTAAAAEAARTGLLVGPQPYNGAMTEVWDLWYEVLTWCLDANPARPNGAKIPLASLIPYYDARRLPAWPVEGVLFSSSRAQ